MWLRFFGLEVALRGDFEREVGPWLVGYAKLECENSESLTCSGG